MLDKNVQDAINKQINAEFFSAHLYLSMAAYFESKSLSGMASWMRLQYEEEIAHGMKMFDYVHQRGGEVVLFKIDAPNNKWESPLKVFEAAYEHECKVTKMIHDLVDVAVSKKDRATETFLQWYVTEQVEEEDTASGTVEKLKLIGDNTSALLMLDNELGQRTAGE